MARMQTSAVLVAREKIEYRQFPIPQVGKDDGVLKVELVGVCGSDPKHFRGKLFPKILGHEVVGRITDLGPEAAELWGAKVGDRVVLEATFGCGRCIDCIQGRYRVCKRLRGYGGPVTADRAPHLWGAYGEYLYLPPTAKVHKISESMPAEVAILIPAVLGNGVRWFRTVGGVSIGHTAVIVGPGPQGLAATIAAKESGAKHIVVVGLARDEARLQMAKRLGATHVVALDREDPTRLVADLSDGRMGDTVIDVTGSAMSPPLALSLTGSGGTLVLGTSIGGKAQVPLEIDYIVANEISVLGVNTHDSAAVRAALAIAESGRYPLLDFVTHRYGLNEAERAVRHVAGDFEPDGLIKAVIDPAR